MKQQKQYDQVQEFYRFLYKWHIQYTYDNIPMSRADQQKQFALGLFYSYCSEKHPMKFESFVCLYAAMITQDEEEKFDLVWKMYAENPVQVDEETKQEYIKAARF